MLRLRGYRAHCTLRTGGSPGVRPGGACAALPLLRNPRIARFRERFPAKVGADVERIHVPPGNSTLDRQLDQPTINAKSEAVYDSISVLSGCPYDRGASVSSRGLTLTPELSA